MRFSIWLNAESPGPEDDLDVIDALTAQAVYADQHGFAAICLAQHDGNAYGNPFTFGAYLAPQLHNAYLVLSAVPERWQPARFAESCNALDMLTRGRCVIGVSGGEAPMEEAAERARFARNPLSDEGIVATARQGWALINTGDTAAEVGRKWTLYHSALSENGHDEATLVFVREWSMVQKPVYVGDSDEEAAGEIPGAPGSLILGGPDTVARAIEDYRAGGVEHLALAFLHGRLDPALASRSLRRFIDEVMPRFTDTISTAENVAASALSQS